MTVMIRILLLALLLTGLTIPAAARAETPPPRLDPERLTSLLHERDPLLIEQIFRRHANDVLPFIDRFLEGALKHVEDGGSEAEATAGFDLGLAFARIASRALEDPVFERYAASFASWDQEERVRFRAAQATYREGRRLEREGSLSDARHAFRRALRAAEQLDDTWGIAMNLQAIARTDRSSERIDDSVRTARRAADLYRRLHLTRQEAESMLIAAETLLEADMMRPSLTNSSRAYALMVDKPHDELRARVLNVYLRGLEGTGQTDEASHVRERERERAASLGPLKQE